VRIGIDVGGTKIEGVALADDGRELLRRRVATPRGDYDATVQAIASLVDALEAGTTLRGTIGVGIPGVPSPSTGLVKNANSTWLIGRRLVRDLEARLGRPVRVANDANCFALSEATDGAAAGADVVFGVIVGTGTGGGIVIGGQVVTGANAIAGEWGHNPLPWPGDDERPGPACYCGRSGCIETFLSGPGLARDYAGGDTTLTAEDVERRANAGDAHARAALTRYETRMARALACIVNVLDPDVIVLGGGMSNLECLYESVPRLWGAYVFACGASDEQIRPRLVRARHGDASGVRGAAWLWPSGAAPPLTV
jgi:fructokinase